MLKLNKWTFYSCIAFLVLLISLSFKPFKFELLEGFHVNPNKSGLEYKVPSKIEVEYINYKIPQTGKTYIGFKQALAFKESRGQYKLVNSLGYMGKYQFGIRTLRTIGINDSTVFINNPLVQEKAFNALVAINKYELRKEIKKFDGQIIKGIVITESGLIAAAHLGGAGSVKKFLYSNGNRGSKDKFGTSVRSYIHKFGGYDVSKIKASRVAKVKIKNN